MIRKNFITVFSIVLLNSLCSVQLCEAIPDSCMKIYDEGGAPGVLQSEKCLDWGQSSKFGLNQRVNCQFNTSRGRRRYQEDRITCDLDMKIPWEGNNGSEEVSLGALAVFDGHIGEYASAMASRVFIDYFYLHMVFVIYKETASCSEENALASGESLNQEKLMRIMKGALTRTIYDIDNSFTKTAVEFDLSSGTTAVTAILYEDHVLVANVGDSKAFLCSEKINSLSSEPGKVDLCANKLTRDHNANIPEERARIEAAGGVVEQSSFGPLVNGHFPMTRAIGDVPLKRAGIIADPEMTDWRLITEKDRYLVVSSDGIFESLSPDDVCGLLQDKCASEPSLPECIVRTAFERRSKDNISVIVVPLNITSPVSSQSYEL